MVNDSASNLVLLIVSLTVAAAIGGVVIKYSQRISSSISSEGSDLSQQIKADISLINDPEYMFENVKGEDLMVVYVKNTGSTVMDNSPRILSLFVDGQYTSEENIISFSVVGKEDWIPESTAKITTNYSKSFLGTGDHKVSIEIFNNEDSLKFYVEG